MIEFKEPKVTAPEHIGPAIEEIRGHLKSVASQLDGTVSNEAAARAAEDIKRISGEMDDIKKTAMATAEAVKMVSTTLPKSRLEQMADKELKHFPRSRLKSEDPTEGVEFDPEFGAALVREPAKRHAMHDFMFQPESLLREYIPEDAVGAVMRARRLHDACVIVDAYMNAVGGNRAAEYQRRGGVRSLRIFDAYSDAAVPFERALAEGSGAGGTAPSGTTGTSWVPTGYATTLVEDVRLALRLLAQFQTINMPQNPYMFPVQGLPFKGYKVPEASGDFGASGYAASSPSGIILSRNLQTLNMVFNAVKLASLMTTSTELEEDSIVPIVSMIRTELAFAMAATAEDAGWNGNYTSHVDTGWSLATPATNTDHRTSWDGLRYGANLLRAVTQVALASGGLTGENFAAVKGAMGRYGGNDTPSDVFWGMGYMAFAKCLMLKDATGYALVATMDKYGDGATIKSGVLGQILGGDVIVGQDYPQTLDSNGLMTSTSNTLTSITCANKRAYKVGVRRGVLIEASRERLFEYDQILFKSTQRLQLKPVWTPGSGTAPLQYTTLGSIVNIPTT